MGSELVAGLLNLLFPPQCLLCRSRITVSGNGSSLCAVCRASFSPFGWFCIGCGLKADKLFNCNCEENTSNNILKVFALSRFEKEWRAAIHRFKYFGKRHTGEGMGRLLGESLQGSGIHGLFDMITAVPLHPVRERARGYNQAEHLARYIAKELDLPYHSLLLRVRDTVSQISLSGRERSENIRGAFSMRSDAAGIEGRHLLLVDDVFTTGATLGEAAKILAGAGAAKVSGAVVAMQPK